MAGHLIVGLDVSSRARAEDIITALGDTVDYYKIGYQCFMAPMALRWARI